MKVLHALASGLVGALALTLLHETARRAVPDAPRVDRLGMQAIAKSLRKIDRKPPDEKTLFRMSLLGDILSNGLYYSLVGLSGNHQETWWSGGLLGLAAGLGAVYLPASMGLSREPTNRERSTQVMTVLWYLTGGLVSAAVYRLMREKA